MRNTEKMRKNLELSFNSLKNMEKHMKDNLGQPFGYVHDKRSGEHAVIPYAVLFQLQACSFLDDLYAVGHYHPGKQRNLNGSRVRTSPKLIHPYHQPALLYCDLSRTNAGLFRVPCPSIQEHVGCHTLD
ncbi:hypothetical protein TNCV_1962581 [Trichonephila clavipes]|nr:hypothetical protein TNCV_1962581 [Trichonephila clavipes]